MARHVGTPRASVQSTHLPPVSSALQVIPGFPRGGASAGSPPAGQSLRCSARLARSAAGGPGVPGWLPGLREEPGRGSVGLCLGRDWAAWHTQEAPHSADSCGVRLLLCARPAGTHTLLTQVGSPALLQPLVSQTIAPDPSTPAAPHSSQCPKGRVPKSKVTPRPPPGDSRAALCPAGSAVGQLGAGEKQELQRAAPLPPTPTAGALPRQPAEH